MTGWRGFIAAVSAIFALGCAVIARAEEPKLGDNGLYVQPWFLASFLDLSDDHAEAAQKGKRLVILWEQKGCPYCKDLHLTNLANPEIAGYIRRHFEVLQLDLWGARKVKDFDGEEISEKALAQKYGVRLTPTIQFFPLVLETGAKTGTALEVARMPGYLRPFPFYVMFQFVREEAYASTSLRDFLARRRDESVKSGGKAHTW
jgi:thioredoxin-related protein